MEYQVLFSVKIKKKKKKKKYLLLFIISRLKFYAFNFGASLMRLLKVKLRSFSMGGLINTNLSEFKRQFT